MKNVKLGFQFAMGWRIAEFMWYFIHGVCKETHKRLRKAYPEYNEFWQKIDVKPGKPKVMNKIGFQVD